jgi:thiosulfate dehydrogenase [quinone] large subunit
MAKKSKKNWVNYIWALSRISLGFVFLWAFVDKLFGLGYSTCKVGGITTVGCSSAWVSGGSPAGGFLSHVSGPFANFYSSLAGIPLVDWLFMLGLLGIGVGLILGIAMKLSAITGSVLLLMMWAASLWPSSNPFVDQHIIYILLILGLAGVNKDQVLGLRKVWVNLPVVRKFSWLE